MPLTASSLPRGFSWLRPSSRPSAEEVDAYAHIIANAEGYPSEASASRLIEEAELQLWTWRNETRQLTKRRRQSSRRSERATAA